MGSCSVETARVIATEQVDRRASPRLTFGRQGTLRAADCPPLAVTISEFTREGCYIHTALPLAPNAPVNVGLAHIGLTPGRVVWRNDKGYGCRFDRPLIAGAVTAALRPCNVSEFPMSGATMRTRGQKLSPGATLTIIVALALTGWAALGTIVGLVIW